VTVPAAALLAGTGAVAAGTLLTVTAAASLAGAGSLGGRPQVTAPVTEPSVTWSAIPAPPRWTCTPIGGTALPVFLPISSLSLECVNVTWNSDLDGTSVDPTGQTEGEPELPVYFAFPPTSGNYQEPAQPSAWFTGSWLLNGTGKGFVAQCLVGPGGGVVTLASGQAYDVLAKVTGDPEAPVKFAGVQAVF
jgi:hypothetical protein